MKPTFLLFCLIFACLAHILLSIWAFYDGRINEDEGWYLLAGFRVWQGEMPYRDFAFTQSPLMPYLLAGWVKMGNGWTRNDPFFLGRLCSLFFSTATFISSIFICKKLGGWYCSAIAALLLGCNLDQIYFSTLIKTYAPAAFFAILGFAFRLSQNKKLHPLALMAWSVSCGFRMSLLPLWILGVLDAILRKERLSILAALTLFALFLPWILAEPTRFWFWSVIFHVSYDSGDISNVLTQKYELSKILMQNDAPFIMAVLLCLSSLRLKRTKSHDIRLLGFSVLTLFIVHVVLKRSLAEYQTVVAPLAAIWLACQMRFMPSLQRNRRFLILFLFAIVSIPAQFQTTYARTHISGLTEFSRVKRVSQHLLPLKDQPIFTLHPIYALSAHCPIVYGLEMSIFSYAPELSDVESQRLFALNQRQILKMLEQGFPVLISESDFQTAFPSGHRLDETYRMEIIRFLEDHDVMTAQIPDAGQFMERLTLYRAKRS